MAYTCKTCLKNFKKKLTLKEKFDRIKIEFCSKDCATAYTLVNKTKVVNKRINNSIPKSSKEEIQFGDLLQSYYPKLERQYKIKDYYHNYDFYIPELQLLVEYNGSYWHNMPKNRLTDRRHLDEATKKNVSLAVVTDLEWKAFLKSGVPDLRKVKKLLNYTTKNFKK